MPTMGERLSVVFVTVLSCAFLMIAVVTVSPGVVQAYNTVYMRDYSDVGVFGSKPAFLKGGSYLTVCDAFHTFTNDTATKLCRFMGYSTSTQLGFVSFGDSSVTAGFDNVRCLCASRWGSCTAYDVDNPSCNRQVNVQCGVPPPSFSPSPAGVLSENGIRVGNWYIRMYRQVPVSFSSSSTVPGFVVELKPVGGSHPWGRICQRSLWSTTAQKLCGFLELFRAASTAPLDYGSYVASYDPSVPTYMKSLMCSSCATSLDECVWASGSSNSIGGCSAGTHNYDLVLHCSAVSTPGGGTTAYPYQYSVATSGDDSKTAGQIGGIVLGVLLAVFIVVGIASSVYTHGCKWPGAAGGDADGNGTNDAAGANDNDGTSGGDNGNGVVEMGSRPPYASAGEFSDIRPEASMGDAVASSSLASPSDYPHHHHHHHHSPHHHQMMVQYFNSYLAQHGHHHHSYHHHHHHQPQAVIQGTLVSDSSAVIPTTTVTAAAAAEASSPSSPDHNATAEPATAAAAAAAPRSPPPEISALDDQEEEDFEAPAALPTLAPPPPRPTTTSSAEASLATEHTTTTRVADEAEHLIGMNEVQEREAYPSPSSSTAAPAPAAAVGSSAAARGPTPPSNDDDNHGNEQHVELRDEGDADNEDDLYSEPEAADEEETQQPLVAHHQGEEHKDGEGDGEDSISAVDEAANSPPPPPPLAAPSRAVAEQDAQDEGRDREEEDEDDMPS